MNFLKKKLLLSNIFFYLFLIFAVIGLIGPKWGMGYAPAEFRRGLDVVFAVDVSRSMDIRDASSSAGVQSRLNRGLFIARETIISVPGARYAAAIGRGRGSLTVPLTYDSEAALIFLESIDALSMSGRSTNLEALVDAAAGAFQETSPARKVIILISDGESHSGIFRNAVNRCVREGIIVCTIAVGSDEGQRILTNANDPDSPSAISKRESAVMKAAAERTNGIYIDGNRDDAVRDLSVFLLSISQNAEPGKGKQEPVQRRPLFVILALISFCISKFVTRQSTKQFRILPLVSVLLFVSLFSSCTEGKLLLLEANYLSSLGRFDDALVPYHKALNHKDAAPYAEYGLGLTYYLLDMGEIALQRYGDSQNLLENFHNNEHRELRYRNHYNSGIIFFEEGDYESAVNSFREALRMDPKRLDAKRNLELSIMSISMESKTDNRTEGQQEQREILFEYLKQEEQQLWRSREWAPEEPHLGPDY
ncbi:MAG: VWA domain-containing protein [Treponema sp.]|nr:VWA domain-containing protein [Treponema sp.]